MPKENVFLNRFRSVGYAFKGALHLIKTESSIKIQIFIAAFVIICGFYFNISSIEWIMQLFAIGLVLTAEGVNTAIEKIADFIHPEKHHQIGEIKDISAGAVLIAAIVAILIGLIIYIPKIF